MKSWPSHVDIKEIKTYNKFMIKLLKNNIEIEVSNIEVYPDYTEIYCGPHKKIVTSREWAEYTVINDNNK